MKNIIGIDVSVVSSTGRLNTYNNDNFFINGRYKYEYELDNIQVSIENEDDAHLFAVFDGLEGKDASFSMIDQLQRLYDETDGKVQDNLSEYKSCVENACENLQGSDEDTENGLNFSGLLVCNGQAAAVSSGENRIFLFRKGTFKHLTVDYTKAKRLLKLGIITDEQAENLSRQLKDSSFSDESEHKISCSEIINIEKNDIFLICSDGLGMSIDDDRIQEILEMQRDTWFKANLLVSEALKNGGEDDVTAMVVKADEVEDEAFKEYAVDQDKEDAKIVKKPKYRFNKQKAIGTLISVTTVLLIIAGIILTAYKIWEIKYRDDDAVSVLEPSPSPKITTQPEPTEPPATPERTEPTAIPESTPQPTENELTRYTVQKGDTLYEIARKFYEDQSKYKLIAEYNKIEDYNSIKAGQVLIIPDEE